MERVRFKDLFAKVPPNYEQLTAQEFQNIFKVWGGELEKPLEERNFCLLFKAITGLTIANQTPETETAVAELLRWVVEVPVPYSRELPATIYLEGRTVQLPKKVGALTYGQNVMLRQALAGSKFYEELICFAAAVCIQQAFDGGEKFIPARARELATILEDYPAKLIYPIGIFTLSLVPKRGNDPRNFWGRLTERFRRRLWTSWLIWRHRTNLSRTNTISFWGGIVNALGWTRMRFSSVRVWIRSSVLSWLLRNGMSTTQDLKIYGSR